MALALNPTELRVLGALVEKELATPDYYPLSLAALVAACNQKTNRDPVTALTEAEVVGALERLTREGLARERNPAGSRVSKYGHRLGDGLGLAFGFDRAQRAVLAVLMLRGPQTPGELNARSERLRGPGESGDVEGILAGLVDHPRGPWVRELPRAPGQREARWMHLMAEDGAQAAMPPPEPAEVGARAPTPPPEPTEAGARAPMPPPAPPGDDAERLRHLESAVAGLTAKLTALEARLAALEGAPGEDGGG